MRHPLQLARQETGSQKPGQWRDLWFALYLGDFLLQNGEFKYELREA